MKIEDHRRVEQVLCASILIAVFLVVSLGSRSQAFHEWVHGKKASCCLKHSPKKHGAQSDGSQNPEDNAADPLQPFCQLGFDTEFNVFTVVPLNNDSLEQPIHFTRLPRVKVYFGSFPARAPPILV